MTSLNERVDAQLRTIFMVRGDYADAVNDDPGNWVQHVVEIRPASDGSVTVALSLDDVPTGLADQAARAVLSLTGDENTDLAEVYVTDKQGRVVASRRRLDLPMFSRRRGLGRSRTGRR